MTIITSWSIRPPLVHPSNGQANQATGNGVGPASRGFRIEQYRYQYSHRQGDADLAKGLADAILPPSPHVRFFVQSSSLDYGGDTHPRGGLSPPGLPIPLRSPATAVTVQIVTWPVSRPFATQPKVVTSVHNMSCAARPCPQPPTMGRSSRIKGHRSALSYLNTRNMDGAPPPPLRAGPLLRVPSRRSQRPLPAAAKTRVACPCACGGVAALALALKLLLTPFRCTLCPSGLALLRSGTSLAGRAHVSLPRTAPQGAAATKAAGDRQRLSSLATRRDSKTCPVSRGLRRRGPGDPLRT